MKITRDVILDLLPLYIANEASDDTKTLVEQYLADDPALARLVEKSNLEQWDGDIPVPLNKEHEMKSFEKTKQLLFQQRLLMALAIFATLLLIAFRGDSDGVRWLWIDSPSIAWIIMFVALVFWAAYFNVTSALNK